MMITHEFSVDVKQEKMNVVRIPQYSKDTHQLIITLLDNGQVIPISSSEYKAYLKIAGAAGNFYYVQSTIEDDKVKVILSDNITAFSGRHKAQIDITSITDENSASQETRLCSMPFIIYVLESVYSDDEVIASDDYQALTELLANAQGLINRLTAALEVMQTSVYKYKGSVALYEGLPTNPQQGDVWDVKKDGMNYAWNGSEWDALGQTVDLSALWSKAEMKAAVQADIDEQLDEILGTEG